MRAFAICTGMCEQQARAVSLAARVRACACACTGWNIDDGASACWRVGVWVCCCCFCCCCSGGIACLGVAAREPGLDPKARLGPPGRTSRAHGHRPRRQEAPGQVRQPHLGLAGGHGWSESQVTARRLYSFRVLSNLRTMLCESGSHCAVTVTVTVTLTVT
jgi:hypothetical protein